MTATPEASSSQENTPKKASSRDTGMHPSDSAGSSRRTPARVSRRPIVRPTAAHRLVHRAAGEGAVTASAPPNGLPRPKARPREGIRHSPQRPTPRPTSPATKGSSAARGPVATPRASRAKTPPPIPVRPIDWTVASPPWPTQNAFATRPSRRRKWAPAVVIASAAAAVAVVLALSGVFAPPPGDTADPSMGTAASTTAARSWIYANVPATERVILDAGAPLADWRAADVIVVDDAMRAATAFPELSEAIANSVTVASFGSGAQLVEIRRVVAQGAVLAAATESAEAAQRGKFGAEVARNPGVVLSDSDRLLLASGRVDSRIALVLGSLAAPGPVVVDGFPEIDGERGSTLRQVSLSAIGGEPLVGAAGFTARGSALVSSLTGDFAPDDVSIDGDALVLRYGVTIESLGR